MKNFYLLTLMILVSAFAFTQNQSITGVQPFISNPIGPQFGGQEIFRFQPGIVTQLQTGSLFDFTTSQWFSIGNLDTALLPSPLTGTNEVFGLRFQLPSKSLILGYQDISDTNPRLQWIGQDEGIGDLEFRVANDFMSTTSNLVATMRSDTGTVFGKDNTPFFDDAKVGILNKRFDNSLEIFMEFNGENPSYGVDVHNLVDGSENYGYRARISGEATSLNIGYSSIVNGNSNERNYGYVASVSGSTEVGFGLEARVTSESDTNFGVFSVATNGSINFGIYGAVANTGGISNNPGDFAGFFDGDLGTTSVGLFVPSDSRLKKRIKDMEFAQKDLLKLKPKVYEYIKSDKINLPQGQQFGFIAQELEEVFPELIKEVKKPVFDKEGNITEYFEYKSVNHIPLIAILTASIQELSREVENLKATNNSYLVYSDRLSSEEQKRLESLAYKLEQNYPNPFSGKSVIEYSLPDNEKDASIMVFDLTGGLLKTFKLSDKSGQVIINSEDFKSGMYLYSLVVRNDEIMTKKMIVR